MREHRQHYGVCEKKKKHTLNIYTAHKKSNLQVLLHGEIQAAFFRPNKVSYGVSLSLRTEALI